MKYINVNGINKKCSGLVFGTATPKLFAAVKEGATQADINAAYELLDEVFDAGINTFDCAAHYGEEIMGSWMESRGNRDQCVIITKCAHPNQWRDRVTDFDILADVHDSLKKLKTDKIDIYMLHRDNHQVPVSVIVDTMNRLHDEGKIGAFGGSNWTHERIQAANEYAAEKGLKGFTVSSPNFGLAQQIADPWKCDAHFGDGCVTISGPENVDARKWYAQNPVTVFAYSSLARGFFSGAFRSDEPEKAMKILDGPGMTGYYCPDNIERLRRCEIIAEKKRITVAQAAMAWIYHQSFDVAALSSPVTKEQIMQNIAAIDIELSEEEAAWMNLEREDIL